MLSKLASLILIPGNLALLLLLAGAGLALFSRTRVWGQRTALVAGGILVAITTLPIGPIMLRALEQRFPDLESCPSALNQKLAGIVLLGGGVSPARVDGRIVDGLNDASDRVWYAASLAKRFPALPLVVSGGQAFDNGMDRREADATVILLEELGVPRTQIVLERGSRTTAENASLSGLSPDAGRWLVVTSAFHMPRAVGSFRKTGVAVIAAPTDWRIADQGNAFTFDAAANLSVMNMATKEYLGLLGYWISGRSSELVPGPDDQDCRPSHGLLSGRTNRRL